MNKSFEENYRAEMMKDIPDLWGRIEAGIEQTTTEPVPAAKQSVQKQQKNGNVRKSNKWIKILAIASPALAACMFGLVMIPAVFVFMVSGAGKGSAMSATDSAMQAAGGGEMYANAEATYDSAETTVETENGYSTEGDLSYMEENAAEAPAEDAAGQREPQAEVSDLFGEVFPAEIVAVTEEEVTVRLENSLAEQLMLRYEVYPLHDTVFVFVLSKENVFVPETGMNCGIVFEEAANDENGITVRLTETTEQNE